MTPAPETGARILGLSSTSHTSLFRHIGHGMLYNR